MHWILSRVAQKHELETKKKQCLRKRWGENHSGLVNNPSLCSFFNCGEALPCHNISFLWWRLPRRRRRKEMSTLQGWLFTKTSRDQSSWDTANFFKPEIWLKKCLVINTKHWKTGMNHFMTKVMVMVFALNSQMHIHLCKEVFINSTHTIIPFSCTLLLLSQSDHLLQWHFQSPEKERLLCFFFFPTT